MELHHEMMPKISFDLALVPHHAMLPAISFDLILLPHHEVLPAPPLTKGELKGDFVYKADN